MATVFYVTTGLFTTLAGSEEPYLRIPFTAIGSVMGSSSVESPARAWKRVIGRMLDHRR